MVEDGLKEVCKFWINGAMACPESPNEGEVIVVGPGLTEVEDACSGRLSGEAVIADDDGSVADVEHDFEIGGKGHAVGP